MAQDWQSVLKRARRKMHDEWASGSTSDVGLRWSNEELCQAVQDGLRGLWSDRPDAFFVSTRLGVMPALAAASVQAAALDDAIPVLDVWAEPLALYVAGTLLSDDVDDGDERSARDYLALWLRALEVN